jgi:hypothetical protein
MQNKRVMRVARMRTNKDGTLRWERGGRWEEWRKKEEINVVNKPQLQPCLVCVSKKKITLIEEQGHSQ